MAVGMVWVAHDPVWAGQKSWKIMEIMNILENNGKILDKSWIQDFFFFFFKIFCCVEKF